MANMEILKLQFKKLKRKVHFKILFKTTKLKELKSKPKKEEHNHILILLSFTWSLLKVSLLKSRNAHIENLVQLYRQTN